MDRHTFFLLDIINMYGKMEVLICLKYMMYDGIYGGKNAAEIKGGYRGGKQGY